MATAYKIQKDTYHDSVTLMLIANDLKQLDRIEEAMVGMGTDYNLDSLKRLKINLPELNKLTPSDLIIAVKGETEDVAEQAVEMAENKLTEQTQISSNQGDYAPPTQRGAASILPGANLVLISIPGEYAADEADKALEANRHVMLFSDNVSLEEELRLKNKAVERELLMMGPDCGTSIINGVPLAFANAIRRGPIGLVAASGTGLQECSSLIHQLGGGISQAIGVGGRDLSEKIAGKMTIQAAQALGKDPQTELITLISKPPDEAVLDRLFKELKKLDKPVVIYFIGADPELIEKNGFTAATDLEDAAIKSCQKAGIGKLTPLIAQKTLEEYARKAGPIKGYLRGLYSGGTLCDEAQRILIKDLQPIFSNTPVEGCQQLEDPYLSQAHTIIDLGEDEFTRGRAHPMIDPTLRKERLIQEMSDPEVGLILLDLVLGYGAHPDMASELQEAIIEGRKQLPKPPAVAVSICGTEEDPQDYQQQRKILEKSDVYVFPSHVSMVKFTQLCLNED